MTVTHKRMDKKNWPPVIPKADNPARKFMSKDAVLKERALENEKRRKMAEAEAKINEELGITAPEATTKPEPAPAEAPDEKDGPSAGERIAELEYKLEHTKGPGAHLRRAKLQKQIDELRLAA